MIALVMVAWLIGVRLVRTLPQELGSLPQQVGTGAGAASSPTRTGAGATGNRKLTVTGGGSSVTFCVAITVVGNVPTRYGCFQQIALAQRESSPKKDALKVFKVNNSETINSTLRS